MPLATRVLVPGEEEAVEAFLAIRPNSTIFLRSNLRRAGLVTRDATIPFSGTWAGAFDGGDLVGVAALFWNDNIVTSAESHAGFLARTVAEISDRPIKGILGPNAEVEDARRALGFADKRVRHESKEILYALDLKELVVPPALASGEVQVRAPREAEIPALLEWRMEYCMETSRIPDNAETRAAELTRLQRYQTEKNHFLAARGEELVSYSSFNATLPEVVQIGGVWTPRNIRGHGNARCAVAGSLVTARERGVPRAVLFTPEENPAAQASYAAIGFRRVGDYGVVLFD